MAPSGNPSANASASRSHRFAARGECVDLVALDHFPAWREWKTAAMHHHCRMRRGTPVENIANLWCRASSLRRPPWRSRPRITDNVTDFPAGRHQGDARLQRPRRRRQLTLRPEATAGVCRKGFLKHFRPLSRVPCGLKSLQIRGLECDAWAADRFPRLLFWTGVFTWALCMARVVGGARMAGICSPGMPCMTKLRCSMLAASTAA